MKLYAPKYYKDFACIADRCSHSCCVGWEIDVDAAAHQKYRESAHPYAKTILKSIKGKRSPHFSLREGDRCPHLNEKGLCRIILELGEPYLCDICREHPRFYNFAPNAKEVGLGLSCEEACRIILASDEYADLIELCEVDGEGYTSEIDTVAERERVYSMLSDRDVPYRERLSRICEHYGVSPQSFEDGEWRELLSSLEYLSEERRERFTLFYSSLSDVPHELEAVLERAFAYFVFRHCTEADSANEYRERLGLCLTLERVVASLCANGADIEQAAREVSEELEYSEDNTDAIRSMFS